MLDYTDTKWNELMGGYRIKYNPVPALQKLEKNEEPEKYGDELWEELYHQGDVGEASYAALVKLVDIKERQPQLNWNIFSYALALELARQESRNPPVPDWLHADYTNALERLYRIALQELEQATDEYQIYSILGIIALHKKQYSLAEMLLAADEDTLKDYFENR